MVKFKKAIKPTMDAVTTKDAETLYFTTDSQRFF
ncbi:MAG: hypothetical protein Pg6C_20010 [Treponemataceae bacterium]|nr:MAG: hypothetical protein Pg6C_20010 [Treponemataceae bacterium]